MSFWRKERGQNMENHIVEANEIVNIWSGAISVLL